MQVILPETPRFPATKSGVRSAWSLRGHHPRTHDQGDQRQSLLLLLALLKIGHVPEAGRIVGRDEEISKLAKRLKGAVHGYSPENVMIYGKTGTGKSLVSKHVCQWAQNAAQDGVEIGKAYIDCAEDNTETQVVSSLAAKLNDESTTEL